ncbi:methylthioribose kinase [Bacillus mangrovi]|uniref:Methylthioribose kinase n=1 Tax=Metabacillus mangrovi TaxID=1491830 RepID=A0A7X2S326_9BACI|nr:methylthioribose kinase [Metabacillus mangrovi]MTH52610.1 methylthioribose kinase [Metabacillus mangrovi]
MIQRFIELGQGYSDLYELLELIQSQHGRIQSLLVLHSESGGRKTVSAAVIMKPTDPGNFQAIYICREGISDPAESSSKRYELFMDSAEKAGKKVYRLEVKPSSAFHEITLYYQYVTGILRLNHILPPLG